MSLWQRIGIIVSFTCLAVWHPFESELVVTFIQQYVSYFLQKRKGKPSGKRKRSKVATSKLSNKRLNKLAKQGKLKKSLPKGKYLQLLQQRTGQRKTLPNKNDDQQTVGKPASLFHLLTFL